MNRLRQSSWTAVALLFISTVKRLIPQAFFDIGKHIAVMHADHGHQGALQQDEAGNEHEWRKGAVVPGVYGLSKPKTLIPTI